MSKRPAIRFKGHTSDWTLRKLSTMCGTFEYGLNAAATEYDGRNKYIRITDIDDASREFSTANLSSPATCLEGMERYLLTNGDIVFARTGASTGKTYLYKERDGVVYFAGFLIRTKVNKENDPEFVFQNTLTPGYEKYIKITSQRSGQPGVNAQEYGNYELFAPLIEEQIQIGHSHKNLDELILWHQRKYDKLQTYKKAMLEKMFPKDGAAVPEVRFAGHTKPWQHLTFGGEIVLPYSDPVATPNGGYERLGIRSHAKGTFHNFVPAGQELETAQMHRVKANNFIVNITFGWEHAVAITDTADEGKLVSHRFPQFSFNKRMVPSFFKYQIIDEKFRHHLWLSSPGGAGRNRVLNINQMLEYRFWVTDEDEQNKIAHFFGRLDEMIELQHEKLTRIKNIKKALLEKMFV